MSEIPLDSVELGAGTVVGKVSREERTVTLRDIFRQIMADTFSKEVQTSPTYSYQWLAAEVGHVGLGLWVSLLSQRVCGWSPWYSFALVAFLAILKEARDLYENRRIRRSHFSASKDLRDLAWDAATATWYMVLGAAFGAGLSSGYSLWWLVPWLVGLLAPVLPWLRQKIYFQNAGLPFLFRLPEFPDHDAGAAARALVNAFVSDIPGKQRHLAIVGDLDSGKTSLAVGIGTEAAFNGRVARYVTFSKLLQIEKLQQMEKLRHQREHEPPAPRNTQLWPWRESQVLVIDDVIADPKPISAGELAALVGDLKIELQSRSVVWVIDAERQHAEEWVKAIENAVGIRPDLVELDKTANLDKIAKRQPRALVARAAVSRKVDFAGATVK